MGKQWKQWENLFIYLLGGGSPKSLQLVTVAMKLKKNNNKNTCSWEEKLWPNLDSILKSRDITLSTKVSLVKAMVFPVVVYGYESWAIKKAEHRRIDAFELWCWRRLLTVPWTVRKSTLNIHWKDLYWSRCSNTLATWCKEPTHWKRSWCWERLRAGGDGGNRG